MSKFFDYLEEYTVGELKDEIKYLRNKLDERNIPYENTTLSGNKKELKRKVVYLEGIAEQHGGENIAATLLKTFGKGTKRDLKTGIKGARVSRKSGSTGSYTQVHVAPHMHPKYERVIAACKRAGYGAMIPSHKRKGWDNECPFRKEFLQNPRRFKLPKEYR